MSRSASRGNPVVLPAPPDQYDARDQRELRRLVAQALQNAVSSASVSGDAVATEVAVDAAVDAAIATLGLGALATRNDVTEAFITLADNVTDNVSTAKHGFAPKAPNDATKYLDGTGAYSVPAGGGGAVSALFTRSYILASARVVGTTYQNTSGRPMLIAVTVGSTSANNTFKVFTDAAATPTTEVHAVTVVGGSGYFPSLTFWVENNHYYKITVSGTGSTNFWVEHVLSSSVTWSNSGDLGPSGANTRARGTVYQNTSGNTMMVQVVGASAGTETWVGTSDTAAAPADIVWSNSSQAAGRVTASFIVPTGHYYKVTSSGTPTVVAWREYQMNVACSKSVNLFTGVDTALKRILSATTPANAVANASGKTRFVAVVGSSSIFGTTRLNVSNEQTVPVTYVSIQTIAANAPRSMLGVVLPLDFYLAYHDGAGVTSTSWFEYDLG